MPGPTGRCGCRRNHRGLPEQPLERKPKRHGYYLWQSVCYYRYPSGQYAAVDPHYCNSTVPPPANIAKLPELLNAGLAVRAAQPMKRTGRETPAEISWCFHQ